MAARYDVIGFDPRGVGAQQARADLRRPGKRYYEPPRPDNVPADEAAERVLLGRAETYAAGCWQPPAWLPPYMTTENAARDVEALRQALGEEKISRLGYSYGTYLGSVYATLFPDRVRRMVLDSVVDPTKVCYDANLDQNVAFDDRHRDFLDWVADNNDLFRLSDTEEDVSFAWYGMRKRLAERPAGGVDSPSELDDTFTVGGYNRRGLGHLRLRLLRLRPQGRRHRPGERLPPARRERRRRREQLRRLPGHPVPRHRLAARLEHLAHRRPPDRRQVTFMT